MIKFAYGWDSLYGNLNRALARLPKEVYKFVVDNVRFCAGHSQMLQVKELKKHFIIILGKSDSQTTVAHEIAHAYLNHTDLTKDREERAEELRLKWGFKGVNLPKACRRVGCNYCLSFNCFRRKV